MTDIKQGEAIEAEAAVWLARHDKAEHWTAELESELQSWIARSPAHHIAWLRLSAVWRRMDRIADAPIFCAVHPRPAGIRADAAAPAGAVDDGTARVDVPRLDLRGTRRRALAGWALAASIILGVGFATFPRFHPKGGESLETRMGAREQVTLSDGSRVTLNTSTRGRAIVNEKERRFWLEEGEVYFEIAHDSTRPFVVQAGRDRVTVLGTKFSVRHEHGRSEITVLEGRVQLDSDSDGGGPASKPVVMTRNESAVATAGNVLVIARNEQAVRDELSWRVGRLVFDQMTLADVAARFNRYNGTQLAITGAAAERRFSGSFDATNVEGFARLLHESFGLEVHRDGARTLVVADRP